MKPPSFEWSRRRLVRAAGAMAAATVLPDTVFGQSAFPGLEGRTVTLLIGSDLGGGYDLFGRVLARHLERTVAGLRVSIQNVGKAGGKLCASMIQEGPPDGSVIALPPVSLMSAQFLDKEGIAYDVATWSWIGKLASETRLLVKGPGATFGGISDLRDSVATLSVRSTSSFAYYETMWLNALLGTRIMPVPGYKAGEKEAAMASGEVMMTTVNYPDDLEVLQSPGVQVVLRVNDAVLPAPYNQVPTLAALRDGDRRYDKVARFLEANYELARWVVAPPSLDREMLAGWRSAFDATTASPDFIAEARKLNIELHPMSGAELADRIGQILADQDALRAELEAAFACGKSLSEGNAAACGQS